MTSLKKKGIPMDGWEDPPYDTWDDDPARKFFFDYEDQIDDIETDFAIDIDDGRAFRPPPPTPASNPRGKKAVEAENLAHSVQCFSDVWQKLVQPRGQVTCAFPEPLKTSVMKRLQDIVGLKLCQEELLTLRKGLLGSILPPITRNEKRCKERNIATFEIYKKEILSLLENREIQLKLIEIVLNRRCPSQQSDIMCHILQV